MIVTFQCSYYQTVVGVNPAHVVMAMAQTEVQSAKNDKYSAQHLLFHVAGQTRLYFPSASEDQANYTVVDGTVEEVIAKLNGGTT